MSAPTEEEPKLVEQLKLLREEWGEGFDEDIARPFARIVKTLREQHQAFVREHNRELDEAHEKVDDLEGEIEDQDALREQAPDALLEDLRDVERGVRTLEEVMQAWEPVSV